MSPTGIRFLKKAAIIVLLISTILIISLIIVQFFRGDKIKNLIVTELNEHLSTKVNVGQIDFSLINSFPYASLSISDIAIEPTTGVKEAPGLLKAEKVLLKFNLLNIITRKYTIHAIEIEKADINIYEKNSRQNNYNIWKSTSTASSENVDFDIQKLILISSNVLYHHADRNDVVKVYVDQIVLKGSFKKENYLLTIKGICKNEVLSIAGNSLLNPCAVEIESALNIDTRLKKIDFKKSDLNIENVAVRFLGMVKYEPAAIDITIISAEGNGKALLRVLPGRYTSTINKYNPEGEFAATGSIKGNSENITDYVISANYQLKNASLSFSSGTKILNGITAKGSFYYPGKINSETIHLSEIQGKIKSGRFKGSCSIRNMSDPSVILKLSAKGDIAEFSEFMQSADFTNLKGNFIADIQYNGLIKNRARPDRNITGQVQLSEAAFQYKMQQIKSLNGAIELHDNKLFFNGLTCEIGNSDLKANGYIENLINHLFDDNQKVFASLNLYSEKIILDDLINLVTESGSNLTAEGSIFPSLVSFKARVSIGSLNYKKLKTNSITGNFSLEDNVLRGSEISIDALNGNIKANGVINGKYSNRAQIVTRASFKEVDINQLFYQFNDFGQKSLLSSNLKGTADVSVDFATSLSSDYTVNTETVEAIADVEIRNGELNGFEPLQALSRFLDAKELSNVRFATLNNRIEILHKQVIIPKMEIQSSAINLIGYGTHTFGNEIDYHVNMLLADVLRAKRKKDIELENYAEEDGYGKPRLFLKVSGPIDNPLVQYDTKAVGKKIADDLKNEKQVFKEVLRKEFGKKSTHETNTHSKSPSKQSPAFEIEWDETK